MVDDTGDPAHLGSWLADLGGMPVVHLSCHGLNAWSPDPGTPQQPVLWMEDELGRPRPTTAAHLVPRLGSMARLVFVSACLTTAAPDTPGHLPPDDGDKGGDEGGDKGQGPLGDGRGGLVAHSLATALVTAGVPAVIGWDGSVDDRAATLFAAHLYPALADRAGLAVAVGDARRALLREQDLRVRAAGILPRLWLGPTGGGPLVAGTRERSLVSARRGITTVGP